MSDAPCRATHLAGRCLLRYDVLVYVACMERVQTAAKSWVPLLAITLTAGAAVSFGIGDAVGFLSDDAEAVFLVSWLLGWGLLAWSSIVTGFQTVLVGRRFATRRQVSWREGVLTVASLAIMAGVWAAHPLWGTGSAVGG